MKRTPRQSSKLSESLHRQLNSYTLAASAAGVGALALVQPLDARVIYTNTGRITIGWNQTYPLDLNHDRKADFTIDNRLLYVTSGELSVLSVKGTPGNKVEVSAAKIGYPAPALKRGAIIGSVQTSPKYRFHSFGTMAFSCTAGCTGGSSFNSGGWANVRNRYLGLQFQIKGKTHYGWARMSVFQIHEEFVHPWIAILNGFAYETTPNKAIIAGKTKGLDVITVPMDTKGGALGHLALGRK